MFFITLHGFPTATVLDGISLFTTLPAPITTLFPIVTPGKNKQTMAKTAKTAAIICKTFESLSFILPLLFLNFPSIFNIS